MKKRALYVIFLVFFMPLTAQELNFYVSTNGNDGSDGKTPQTAFLTIEKAQQAVRAAKEGKNFTSVNVYIKGGDYQPGKPIVLKPEDSGSERMQITYQSLPGEKVQISGGKKITGWKKGKKGLWQASIPEAKDGKWKFEQIWVNGETRYRARTPDTGFYRVDKVFFPEGNPPNKWYTRTKSFGFKKGDLNLKWTNLQDVVVIVYHFWTDSHMPVESIDDKTNIVTFKYEDSKQFSDDFTTRGARYIVENVFEALDQPGEWYLNKVTGILYYMPKPGEDINSVEVIAPVITEFISFEGIPLERKYVEHISFKNLNFSHTFFVLPEKNTNSAQGSSSVSACFAMKGTRYCSFENCTINNIGTFAFEIGQGCTYNRFMKNTLDHLAGGGFRVNGGAAGSNPLIRTGYNEFTDNTVSNFGEIYPSAVGFLLMHTFGNKVAHNHIHHGFYTGISIGWVWGYMPSISRDNLIEYNYIHHIGQGLLSDMGAIYTLGISPGTKIRNNLIHDVESAGYGGWGIYMDEGTSHLLVENNVVYNTKYSAFNVHYCKEVTVRNNVFAVSRIELLQRQRVEPHQSLFFENNILYWKQGKLLSADWVDEPYEFYYKAIEPKTRKMTATFSIDYNVYFNPNLSKEEVRFGKQSWAEWNGRGKDTNSVYGDPMFVDPDNYDFRLKPGSPAFTLGFRQIDLSTAGPRK